jgi:hypothetical protein
MTQIERAQIMYTQSCKGIRLQSYQNETVGSLTTENISQTCQTRELPLGYALPKPKSTVRFTLAQQTYLIDLFNAGIHYKNNRARPGAVAHDMLYHFEPELCLFEAQILAYFSRLSAKQKKTGYPPTTTTLPTTSSTNNSKKAHIKKKPIDLPLFNNDHEQELHETKVLIEKRYNMRERLVKNIVNECQDESEEDEDEEDQ